jgi:hypothetical protein
MQQQLHEVRDSDTPPSITSNGNSANNVVDSGETVVPTDIIPYSALGSIVEPLRDDSKLPLHEQLLMNGYIDGNGLTHSFNAEERDAISNLYDGLTPKSFKSFAGRTVRVFGLRLFEQPGGWKGKDQLYHEEGYFQVQILLQDDQAKGEPLVIVKSSGAVLAKRAFHAANAHGWFLFEEPIYYYLEVGEDNSHRMYNKDLDVRSLLEKKGK